MTDPRRTAAVDLVCEHLADQGYTVLDRDWQFAAGGLRGTLDVVARAQTGLLAIVEVRVVQTATGADHARAVTPSQVMKLRALTSRWLVAREAAFATVQIDLGVVIIPAEPGPLTLRHHAAVA